MTAPAGAQQPGTPSGPVEATGRPGARSERGWWKLILAVFAFVFVPTLPPFRAMLPVEQSMLLFVPALAACALVGWWAGGRAWQAVFWVAIATWMMFQPPAMPGSYDRLLRGWSLLLAGSFGLVCLFGTRPPFFARALVTLGIALALALAMSMLGPVSLQQASHTVSDELARRNSETMAKLNEQIAAHPVEWKQLTEKLPQLAPAPGEMEKELGVLSRVGLSVFPALLALESLMALALAWATYHRLNRTRLGAPLGPLREFRFNDQLVWGLIVGLTIVFLPTLANLRGMGRNLLVFFGALYAIRGLGVLTWFLAPGGLAATLAIAFAMLLWPVLNVIAVFGLTLLALAAFGLGLGDTWADWRRRARSTT